MNKQQLWEKSLLGVYNQGKPSINGSDMCLYRGPEGLKCGIGHLISDEQYDDRMEGDSVKYLALNNNYVLPKYFTKYKDFLQKLQGCHDAAACREWDEVRGSFLVSYLKNMINLGKEYKLNVSKAQRRLRYIIKEKK